MASALFLYFPVVLFGKKFSNICKSPLLFFFGILLVHDTQNLKTLTLVQILYFTGGNWGIDHGLVQAFIKNLNIVSTTNGTQNFLMSGLVLFPVLEVGSQFTLPVA